LAADFIARVIFFGTVCSVLKQSFIGVKAFHPETCEIQTGLERSNNNGNLDLALSMDIPSISIDYAVMERSRK
jgi:mannose-1-phosphate guanylyltransferase